MCIQFMREIFSMENNRCSVASFHPYQYLEKQFHIETTTKKIEIMILH